MSMISNLDLKVNTKSWFKRLDVYVWTDNNDKTDTLRYSTISTIW